MTISTTLKHYTANYDNNLQLFLAKYEDNNEAVFLKNEYSHYFNYFNALADIFVVLKRKGGIVKSSTGYCHVCDKIKKLNLEAYEKLFSNNGNIDHDLQNINETILDNLMTSAKGIVDFIAERQNRSRNRSLYFGSYHPTAQPIKVDKAIAEDWHPKIFKNESAYKLFMKLHENFGVTKEDLSNYSFIYHKMVYDGLIHPDILKTAYFNFLHTLKISIDRIKPLAQIGKITLREQIYNETK